MVRPPRNSTLSYSWRLSVYKQAGKWVAELWWSRYMNGHVRYSTIETTWEEAMRKGCLAMKVFKEANSN